MQARQAIDLMCLAQVRGAANTPNTSDTAAPSTGGIPAVRANQGTNAESEAVKSYGLACASGLSWGGPPGIGCVGNVVWNAYKRNM